MMILISMIVSASMSIYIYKLGVKDRKKYDYFEKIVKLYAKIEWLYMCLDNQKKNDCDSSFAIKRHKLYLKQQIKTSATLLSYYLSRYPDKSTCELTSFKLTAFAIAQSPINSKDYQKLAKSFADFCLSVNKNELKDNKIKLFGKQEIVFKH